MNITKIAFSNADIVHDEMVAIYGYAAKFAMTADGAEYAGTASYDSVEGYDIEWDGPTPDDDSLAVEVIQEAFGQSVSLAVVVDPVDLPAVLNELDLEGD